MLLTILTLLATAAKLFVDVSAQVTTDVTCQTQYNWMTNSIGQSPCFIASALQGQCNGGVFNLTALVPVAGNYYLPPSAGTDDICTCSTVTLAIVSACAICQGGLPTKWNMWSSNCSNVYVDIFPSRIPQGVVVPAWAYLDVIPSNQFNVTAAQADTNAPESTGPAPTTLSPTSTLSTGPAISSTTSSTSPAAASTSPAAASTAPPSGSNAGAIAGGVVGGVIFLGLIAGAIVLFLTRSRRTDMAPYTINGAPSDVRGDAPLDSPPPMPQEYGHPMHGAFGQTTPMVYDPLGRNTSPTTVSSFAQNTSRVNYPWDENNTRVSATPATESGQVLYSQSEKPAPPSYHVTTEQVH